MKISTEWLGDFVTLTSSLDDLNERLTMSGLEVESIESIELRFEKIVAARISSVFSLPDSDHLTLCMVDAGPLGAHPVVCGAANARPGVVAALALVGAELPDGQRVEASQIRGYLSAGMLCSARELGLGDDHAGILELPGSVAPGSALDGLVPTRDAIIELSLTPNRGDCLSLLGVAREIAALQAGQMRTVVRDPIAPESTEGIPVELKAGSACPRYVGRVIDGIDGSVKIPLWMSERLRRCGIRSISPVVDITNYVMFALGQPMHAFDLNALHGGLQVRFAAEGENLVLLDGSTRELEPTVLVIADDLAPVALAGVMGGLASGVQAGTTSVFLESAYFDPILISKTSRSLNIHTDASHRFERSVDPTGQERAIEWATRLIVELCGGRPGPVLRAAQTSPPVLAPMIDFRLTRANSILGMSISENDATQIFERLGLQVEDKSSAQWRIRVPPHRPDLRMEIDLVEEIVRLSGYAAIPVTQPASEIAIEHAPDATALGDLLRQQLVGAGYYEAITYSFIGLEDWRQYASESDQALSLANPISRDMAVMRASLWPGLISALVHNQQRQVISLKLFEVGMTFSQTTGKLAQNTKIAGLSAGRVIPEQWGSISRDVDFYDVKQDVVNILSASGLHDVQFKPGTFEGLHPGESAAIEFHGEQLGVIGKLHPKILKEKDILGNPVLFELDMAGLSKNLRPSFKPFPKFPSVRRDLALILAESISFERVRNCVMRAGGQYLKDLQLFDVYRGQGIDSDKKSMALGLIFQAPSSTLTDNQVETAVAEIIDLLGRELGGSLRV